MIDPKEIITYISFGEIGFHAQNVDAYDVLPGNFFDSELAQDLQIAGLDVEINLTVWYRIENDVLIQRKTFEIVGDEGMGYMNSTYEEFIEQIDWSGFPVTEEEIFEKALKESERLEREVKKTKDIITEMRHLITRFQNEDLKSMNNVDFTGMKAE